MTRQRVYHLVGRETDVCLRRIKGFGIIQGYGNETIHGAAVGGSCRDGVIRMPSGCVWLYWAGMLFARLCP